MNLSLLIVRGCNAVVDMAALWGRSFLVPARNPRSYLAICLAGELACAACALVAPMFARVLYGAFHAAGALLLLEGRLWRRMLAFALDMLALLIGEALAALVFLACTGSPARGWETLGAALGLFCLIELADAAFVFWLLRLIGRRSRRLGLDAEPGAGAGEGNVSPAAGDNAGAAVGAASLAGEGAATSAADTRGASVSGAGAAAPGAVAAAAFPRLVLVPLLSLPPLVLLVSFEAFGPPPSAGDMAALVAVAVLVVAVDALALRDALRAQATRREQERAQLLQARIDVSTQAYAALARKAETAARLRHDARNHLQLLANLIDAGELERAAAYADELEGLAGEASRA